MLSIRNILAFCILVFLLSSCKEKVKAVWISEIPEGDNAELTAELAELTNPCYKSENYIPDLEHLDHTSLKRIKCNFHVIRNSKGERNFSEKEGVKFIKDMVLSANGSYFRNDKMKLPVGNDTPVITGRFGMDIWPTDYIPNDDGIYFHDDDEFYYVINRGPEKNIFKRDVFEKYGIQKDSVVNIFIQDLHIDSLNSTSYKPSSNGVAFATWIKAGLWYYSANKTSYDKNGKAVQPLYYRPAKQLCHEMGHVFGLAHAWGRDNCEDTPTHSNCWSDKGFGPCKVASNNIMDYNANMSALTPCQVGRVHMTALTRSNKRNLLIKDWCKLNDFKSINIKKDFIWNSCKTLQGNLTIHDGARLVMRCETSLANGATITVHPGGELVLQGARLYNDCEGQWEGIKVLHKGKQKGKVTYLGNANIIEDCKHEINIPPANKIKS